MTKRKATKELSKLDSVSIEDIHEFKFAELYNITRVNEECLVKAVNYWLETNNRKIIYMMIELQELFSFDRYIEYKEYRKINKYDSSSERYFMLKYGELAWKDKRDDLISRKTPSLYNCIRLYGEKEGKIKWTQICKSNAGNHKLERFICKYGEDDGNKRWNELQYNLKK